MVIYIYIYVCICICVYIYMCVWMPIIMQIFNTIAIINVIIDNNDMYIHMCITLLLPFTLMWTAWDNDHLL